MSRKKPQTSPPAVEKKKPYAFAPLPKTFATRPPVWHDGSQSKGLLSGEIRCELKTITPLLVGWERQSAKEPQDQDDPFAIPSEKRGDRRVVRLRDRALDVPEDKPFLCPLRAPWGDNPVLIPGDSIKGMLRHELGALLGAPMERVQERVYSYRPNLSQKATPDRVLEPRFARVVETAKRGGLRVPTKVHIYERSASAKATYYPRKNGDLAPSSALWYRGGVSAGKPLPECLVPSDGPPKIRSQVDLGTAMVEFEYVDIPPKVLDQYVKTFRHYQDGEEGHFSSRHPRVGGHVDKRADVERMMKETEDLVFQEDDAIWVEWDHKEVISFGWHYYYRWSYQDTVRTKGRQGKPGEPRPEVSPAAKELELDGEGAPRELTPVRRLLAYVRDKSNPGTHLGARQHEQLMGRVFVNTAIEHRSPVVPPLEITFLKELGQPRPSAVEHYLRQPHVDYENQRHQARRDDAAYLLTYGDAQGRDEPGELAGRKHYLNRGTSSTSWLADGPEKESKHATVAVGASANGTVFRFTVRFRDLDSEELASLLLALCPDQFAKDARGGGKHYCSKLGYARPLGWGSVNIKAVVLLLLSQELGASPGLEPVDVQQWFRDHLPPLDKQLLDRWLYLHERGGASDGKPSPPGAGQGHELAGDYPRHEGEVYTYHTELRGEHARLRRQRSRR